MKRSLYVFTLLALLAGGCAGLLTDGREDSSDPAIKCAAANKLLRDHSYPKSIATFQQILDEYPNSDCAASSIYGIATAYVSAENSQKDYAQALIRFEEFLNKYPQHELAADARNWRQAIKAIIEAKKDITEAKRENERLQKNIEKLKQLDMRQEQKRLGK